MSRRDEIKLSEEEQRELLESERVVVVASHGVRGWPHLMPLWYVVRDGRIWIWTYAKSQKVKNLERDDHAAVLIESGTEYAELRGVMLKTRAELHRLRNQSTISGTGGRACRFLACSCHA